MQSLSSYSYYYFYFESAHLRTIQINLKIEIHHHHHRLHLVLHHIQFNLKQRGKKIIFEKKKFIRNHI
jgi:hypothetical protein